MSVYSAVLFVSHVALVGDGKKGLERGGGGGEMKGGMDGRQLFSKKGKKGLMDANHCGRCRVLSSIR